MQKFDQKLIDFLFFPKMQPDFQNGSAKDLARKLVMLIHLKAKKMLRLMKLKKRKKKRRKPRKR